MVLARCNESELEGSGAEVPMGSDIESTICFHYESRSDAGDGCTGSMLLTSVRLMKRTLTRGGSRTPDSDTRHLLETPPPNVPLVSRSRQPILSIHIKPTAAPYWFPQSFSSPVGNAWRWSRTLIRNRKFPEPIETRLFPVIAPLLYTKSNLVSMSRSHSLEVTKSNQLHWMKITCKRNEENTGKTRKK